MSERNDDINSKEIADREEMSDTSEKEVTVENSNNDVVNGQESSEEVKHSNAMGSDNGAGGDGGNERPVKKKSKLRILLYFILAVFILGVIGLIGIGIYIYILNKELPSTDEFSRFKYSEPMVVYDSSGRVIAELGAERRYPISINDMPDYVYHAVVAVEDGRFYEHSGIDLWGIMRAMVTNLKAGRMVEGGSTLTQQLVKVIYLSPERKLKRKIKEVIIAYKLDKELTKEQILELYLNQVNFGRGAYGIQAAAINYFGKKVQDLTIAEAAMIAGIPKGPSIYAPHLNMNKSIKRRNHVLRRMHELNYITNEEYETALNEKVNLAASVPSRLRYAGFFMDYVHKYIEEELKIKDAQNIGLKVFTTLNLDYQIEAERAVTKSLLDIGKREGYEGPVGVWDILYEDNSTEDDEEAYNVDIETEEIVEDNNTIKYIALDNNTPSYLKDFGIMKAAVTKVDVEQLELLLPDNSTGILRLSDNKWAHPESGTEQDNFTNVFKENDIIYVSKHAKEENVYMLEQDPNIEGALVSINPNSGEIYAMVGGKHYGRGSYYNRAVQAKRQVGSTFKPIVYSAAYESGFIPMSTFDDTPFIQEAKGGNDKEWRPKNFDGQFKGLMTLQKALQVSNNSVTVKLAQKIGIKKIIRYARLFGLTGEMPNDLSVSLGSVSASPLEMAYVYSVFANQGLRPESPYFITRIADIDNKTLFEFPAPKMVKVLEPVSASLMTDNLIKVVERGGAWRSRNAVNRVFGGKTGTSNESKDGWFANVMPNFVTVTWVGYDNSSKMGEYAFGGNTAQFMWIDYFKSIEDKVPLALFKSPVGSYYFKTDNETFEITDTVTGKFSFSIYPVNRDNKPITLNYGK